jgi:hypothetical protein
MHGIEKKQHAAGCRAGSSRTFVAAALQAIAGASNAMLRPRAEDWDSGRLEDRCRTLIAA